LSVHKLSISIDRTGSRAADRTAAAQIVPAAEPIVSGELYGRTRTNTRVAFTRLPSAGIHNKQQRPSGAELIAGDENPIILPSNQHATWLHQGGGRALFINRTLVALVGKASVGDILKIGVEPDGNQLVVQIRCPEELWNTEDVLHIYPVTRNNPTHAIAHDVITSIRAMKNDSDDQIVYTLRVPLDYQCELELFEDHVLGFVDESGRNMHHGFVIINYNGIKFLGVSLIAQRDGFNQAAKPSGDINVPARGEAPGVAAADDGMETESAAGESVRAATRQAAAEARQSAAAAQQQAQAAKSAKQAYEAQLRGLQQQQDDLFFKAQEIQRQYQREQANMEENFKQFVHNQQQTQHTANTSLPPWAEQKMSQQASAIDNLTAQLGEMRTMFTNYFQQQQAPAAPQQPPNIVRINHAQVPASAASLPTNVHNAVWGPGTAATMPSTGASSFPQVVPMDGSPISHDLSANSILQFNNSFDGSFNTKAMQGDLSPNGQKKHQ
jgi:hypothetical protein